MNHVFLVFATLVALVKATLRTCVFAPESAVGDPQLTSPALVVVTLLHVQSVSSPPPVPVLALRWVDDARIEYEPAVTV